MGWEPKLLPTFLEGIDGWVLQLHGELVIDGPAPDPGEVESVPILHHYLICGVKDGDDGLDQAPVVLPAVPLSGVDLPFAGPLPTDTDNPPVANDVLVGDVGVGLAGELPNIDLQGTGLDVEE